MLKADISDGYLVGVNEFPIKTEILEMMNDYNIDKELLLQALQDNKHNHATTSYYLLLNKFEQQKLNKGKECFCYNINQFCREFICSKINLQIKES